MGFWKKIFNKNNNINSSELTGSIVLELDKMQQRILQIGIVLSNDKHKEMQDKIEAFRERIKNSSENDVSIEDDFNKLKKEFDIQLKELGQIYLFNELEDLSKKLTKRCFGDVTEEKEKEEPISFLESKYNSLQGRVDEFSGVKKELYIRELIKTKYRIKVYKSITNVDRDGRIFEDCREEEIVTFATLLIDDVQKLYEYLEKVKREYNLEHIKFAKYEIIEKEIDALVRRMDIEYSKDMDINELLTDGRFMRAFIDAFSQISLLNKNIEKDIGKIKEDREKQEEEERRKEEQAKKDKNISPEEMREVIKQINDDSFDITDSYKDIMEYETRVAEARGLLNSKSKIATDDIAIIRIPKDKVGMYIRNAKKQNIKYSVLYEVDDNKEQSCMVIVSKKDESKSIVSICDNYIADWYSQLKGIYGSSFISFCKEKDNNIYSDGKELYYEGDKGKKKINEFYKDVLELNHEEYLKNVKFYIELSYLRPIIPILELLQTYGIEYYIPPINESFKKSNPTVKIFIDRENYDKYMNEVHKEISNADLGIISVHIEKSFADIMLEGTNSPYIDEEKEKGVMINLK